MRAYLATAPAWFSAAFQALFFVLWMGTWSVLEDHTSWQRELIESAVIGPLFWLLIWLVSRRDRGVTNEILAATTAAQRHEVLEAARTGTPPRDPAVRRAAFVLVRHRLVQFERHQTLTLVMLGVFMALSALLAASDEPWYLAGTVALAWALISALRFPGRSARKLAALGRTGSPHVDINEESRLH